MREKLRFLGMDVHAETIALAVAEPDGEVRSLGTIANREEPIRKFISRLGPVEHLRACYEGKELRKIITAIGRELLGFIGAIGIKAEAACAQQMAA